MPKIASRHVLAVVLLLVVGIAAYKPGLRGPFLFDDFVNIVWNSLIAVEKLDYRNLYDAAFSGNAAAFIPRPLSRLTYGLNYYFSGQQLDPFAFKATNLVIHLGNGVLVYIFASILLGCLRRRPGDGRAPDYDSEAWSWLPVVVAGAWLLHPIQLTSVLYIVQRMTSMSATFTLLALIGFLLGRGRVRDGRPWGATVMWLSLVVGGGIGVLCKENAALTPLFALVLELFFFTRADLPREAKLKIGALFGALLVVPALLVVTYVLTHPRFISDLYMAREFGPVERLLTQPRILFFYLALMAFPNLRWFGLYHEDIPLSTGLLQPWDTLPALLALAALVGFGLWGIRRRSMLAFGVMWFLAGHSMESSVVGLELVHEHRNYLPSFGVLFVAAFYLFGWLTAPTRTRRMAPAILVATLAVVAFLTHTRATMWASVESHTFFTARNHPNSYRSQLQLGALHEARSHDVRLTYEAYQRASVAHPGTLNGVMKMQRIVTGLVRELREGLVAEDEGVPVPEVPDVLRDPLVLNLAYLEKLDHAIGEELNRRLGSEWMDAEMLISLREMQHCLESRVAYCPPLPRVLAWYEKVLGRERIHPTQKAYLLGSLSKVHVAAGDLPRAIEAVTGAAELVPEEPLWTLDLADLLMKNGEYDRAEGLIAKIEAQPDLASFWTRMIADLREQLDKHRRAAAESATVTARY